MCRCWVLSDIISIHALLAESDTGAGVGLYLVTISIHALLAESDAMWFITGFPMQNFYPRSPCGERHGENKKIKVIRIFLSTLSLRRATVLLRFQSFGFAISIHALLAESDRPYSLSQSVKSLYFYPRSPCGERHLSSSFLDIDYCISIHALLAESDLGNPRKKP